MARCQGDNDFLNGIIDTWQEQTEALNDSKLRDQDYTKHIRQLRALRAKVKDRQVSTPMVHDRSLILAGLDDLAEGLLKEVEAITTEAYDEGAKLALLGQNALQTAGDDLFASSFQCVPGA